MPLQITPDSKLSKALKLHPDVLEYVISLNPHDFERLRNPLMVKLMPQRITIARLAVMVERPLSELLRGIHEQAHIDLEEADLQEIVALSAVAEQTNLPTNVDDAPEWVKEVPTAVVDLLESDDRLDTDPFVPLFPVLNRAQPGDVILLIHRWEPQPLYDVWRLRGFAYYAVQKNPAEWWVYIRK